MRTCYGATTLSITKLSTTTFCIDKHSITVPNRTVSTRTLSITTVSTMTQSIISFNITTFSIKIKNTTVSTSIKRTAISMTTLEAELCCAECHDVIVRPCMSFVILSVFHAERRSEEWRYAECRGALVIHPPSPSPPIKRIPSFPVKSPSS
jgi:hypothetical protein